MFILPDKMIWLFFNLAIGLMIAFGIYAYIIKEKKTSLLILSKTAYRIEL